MPALLLYDAVPRACLRQGGEMRHIVQCHHFPLAILETKNVDRGVHDAIRRRLHHIQPENVTHEEINSHAMTPPLRARTLPDGHPWRPYGRKIRRPYG